MKIQDIKVGMKVVPISKSAGVKFDTMREYLEWTKPYSPEIAEGFNKNGFLYVNNIDECSKSIWLWSEKSSGGDMFLPSDLIPYEEPPTQPEPITDSLLLRATNTFYQTTSVLESLQLANPLMSDEQLLQSTDWMVDAVINEIITDMGYPNTDFVFTTILDAIRNDGSFGTDVREMIEGDI